jgi:hypothetical protein
MFDASSNIAVGPEMFDALASILVALPEDDEMNSAYLIAKNREWNIDRGILRLINAFIYSRNGDTTIRLNALEIIHALIEETEQRFFDENDENIDHFLNSLNVSEALVKTLIKEKENTDVVEICLEIIDHHRVCDRDEGNTSFSQLRFVSCGICEALIYIMGIYASEDDYKKMVNVFFIIQYITDNPEQGTECIVRFITTGLLEALVQAFNSASYDDPHKLVTGLVGRLLHMMKA